ncbi:MAG TPA: rRNA cytosine-C5-methylase [Rhodospirillaceae bacterium]|nr:MAG: rRNA cytosine-C5-methylase [Alphaproteobacteria bacterium GWF2_58_20]HAU29934.1 rRNA cytosine-C5-methylase [Rhodospirillaceae bacterium]
MTPAARIQATIELLTALDATPKPADSIASAYFRNHRYIGSKDRTDIAGTFYAILRRKARLAWHIESCGVPVLPRSLLIANILVGECRPPEEVTGIFSGAKFAPAEMGDGEMKLLKALSGKKLVDRHMPDSVRAECPPWAEADMRQALGKDFVPALSAMTEPAPLDLRTNTLKTTREKLLASLRKHGIPAEATPYSPWGLRIMGRPAVATWPEFEDGQVEIQDEGSQLIALLVDAKPGMMVADVCAGAGGKTLGLAATMNNKGRLIAADVLDRRLVRAKERFRRAGAFNIETKPLKSETDPWIKHHKLSFDRVLVDAPCSGTGTWRRNPDSRWKPLGPALDEITSIQARILESAARLVKPGGRLVYATCSLLPRENEDQVTAFLEKNPAFTLVNTQDVWAECPTSPHLKMLPHLHKTDGFFAAVLQRAEAPEETKTKG